MEEQREKPKILFVDDEPNVLEGFRRMLHSMRGVCEMAFAPSGKEDLDLMARNPFDVVITDMRMPGIDGAMLLEKIETLYPDCVRIIISGHSDPAFILKAVRTAHQYLAKPCNSEEIVRTVSASLALRGLLSQPLLRALVSKMGSLPSLPSLYREILEELQGPDPSPQKLGEVIAKDVGMTAKILQMVNSAFFGLFRKVTTATEAVRYLGIDTIKALVLSVHLFQEMRCRGFDEAWRTALWNHSLTTAHLSKKIATLETGDLGISNSAFTAGLLHDSGRLILATCLPEEYGRLLQGPAQSLSPLWLRERDALGASHQEVGAYLLGIWGLPDDIVGAVAVHHIPSTSIVQGGFSPLAAVHIAEALLSEEEEGGNDSESPPWDVGFIRSSGIPEHWDLWVKLYQETAGGWQDEI